MICDIRKIYTFLVKSYASKSFAIDKNMENISLFLTFTDKFPFKTSLRYINANNRNISHPRYKPKYPEILSYKIRTYATEIFQANFPRDE